MLNSSIFHYGFAPKTTQSIVTNFTTIFWAFTVPHLQPQTKCPWNEILKYLFYQDDNLTWINVSTCFTFVTESTWIVFFGVNEYPTIAFNILHKQDLRQYCSCEVCLCTEEYRLLICIQSHDLCTLSFHDF